MEAAFPFPLLLFTFSLFLPPFLPPSGCMVIPLPGG